MIRYTPNALTCSRMAITPVAAAFAWRHELIWACALFIIAALTDMADGAIARHFHVTSSWGAKMDPIADFILMFTALLGLVLSGVWPWWLATVIMVCAVALTVIDKTAATGSRPKVFQQAVHARLSVLVLVTMLFSYLSLATGSWRIAAALCLVGLIGVGYLNRGKLPRISTIWK